MNYLSAQLAQLDSHWRVLLVLLLALAAHLVVMLVRRYGQQLSRSVRTSKTRSVASLATSILVFLMYFGALGLILNEFGVSLTAYLASASIIGLAVAFGSQGMVQDIVTGLTVIFSDLFDVGDMVEISGQTGIVDSIGMRFTVLLNHLDARIYIPNRSISNVIAYPRGHIHCLIDVTRPRQGEVQTLLESMVIDLKTQFPGILRGEPEVKQKPPLASGREFLRIVLPLWPGRGNVIEGAFRQQLLAQLKSLDPDYAEWMVVVSYEANKKRGTSY